MPVSQWKDDGMFDIKMKVVYKNGDVKVYPVAPAHAVALEEKYDLSFLAAFGDEYGTPRLSWLYFTAFAASELGGEFVEWVSTVATLDVVHNGVALFAATQEVIENS